MQIKTFFWFVLRYNYAYVRMAKIWKTDNTKYWKDVETQKQYSHFGRQFDSFLQK